MNATPLDDHFRKRWQICNTTVGEAIGGMMVTGIFAMPLGAIVSRQDCKMMRALAVQENETAIHSQPGKYPFFCRPT